MNQTLLNAFIEQMNKERQNAAAYDALSAQADVVAWLGTSAWMKKAANEEREHFQAFCDFIVDVNGVPKFSELLPCGAPQSDNLPEFYAEALRLEKENTEAIKALHYLAEETEEPQACVFLIPYIAEQTRSERELTDTVTILQRMDKTGWYVFDKEIK